MTTKEYQSQYRAAHKVRIAEQKRAWQINNPDKVRHSDYKRLYSLTFNQVEQMRIEQQNCCKLCTSEFNNDFCVDHCHTTGEIRGLLCADCNRALGMFQDKEEILLSAISYLKGA